MAKLERGAQGSPEEGRMAAAERTQGQLLFLREFLRSRYLSIEDAAEVIGITRQALTTWFVNDDVKLSLIEKLVTACGYKISYELQNPSRCGKALVQYAGRCKEPVKTGERLAFLGNAMDRHGLTKTAVAERVGLTYIAVLGWFKHDDCLLSYVYQVAEMTGSELLVRFEPIRK